MQQKGKTPYAAEGKDPMSSDTLIWTSPSKDSRGSMPIGNGDIGANVWVEENGDLLFYLSKTDAWSENCRLLKLGRVRVALAPNPFQEGCTFSQTLDGEILIRFKAAEQDVAIRFAVDALHPVVTVDIDSAQPVEATVSLEHWRTQRRELNGAEAHSAYGLLPAGGESIVVEPVFVEPDTILTGHKDRVVWYHRNERSIWKANLELQALGDVAENQDDPLLLRTFGALIEGAGLVSPNRRRGAGQPVRDHLEVCGTGKQDSRCDLLSDRSNRNGRCMAGTARSRCQAPRQAFA